jgi:hypothetical protein
VFEGIIGKRAGKAIAVARIFFSFFAMVIREMQ